MKKYKDDWQPGESMDKKVQVMFYPSDFKKIEEFAREYGLSVSSLLRLAVMKYISD